MKNVHYILFYKYRDMLDRKIYIQVHRNINRVTSLNSVNGGHPAPPRGLTLSGMPGTEEVPDKRSLKG